MNVYVLNITFQLKPCWYASYGYHNKCRMINTRHRRRMKNGEEKGKDGDQKKEERREKEELEK